MRMTRRFGFRGTLLILFGLVWVVIGIGAVLDDALPPLIHTTLPGPLRLALWSGTGLTAIYFGLRRTSRDRIGWAALYVMPAFRAVSYLLGWVDYILDFDPDDGVMGAIFGRTGYDRGWVAAAVYALFVAVVVVCSRWPEPVIPSREGES